MGYHLVGGSGGDWPPIQRNLQSPFNVGVDVLTRVVLHLVQVMLLPIEAAGPSRSRLYLHRARLMLRARLTE
jgi:hypothetical protein